MSLFTKIWRGWAVGVSAVFVPIFLLVAVLSDETPDQLIYVIPVVPLVAALQGLLVAALVVLGLKIWPPK